MYKRRFIGPSSAEEIVEKAINEHKPVRIFAGFSGGGDSMVSTHWMMNNVPGCEVLHINTGIGIERTRQFVRETCQQYGWPLIEVRAKEDCGQDYDELVKRWGFPGPAGHPLMYQRLKGMCVRHLVHKCKKNRLDRVMIATGIYQQESARRSKYQGTIIDRIGCQLWVNPLYFWTHDSFPEYRKKHKLPQNPVSKILGMSGECLCGAYAHKGEKALIKIVCPETAARLEKLEVEVRACGHDWGWEDQPPKRRKASDKPPGFLCMGCGK